MSRTRTRRRPATRAVAAATLIATLIGVHAPLPASALLPGEGLACTPGQPAPHPDVVCQVVDSRLVQIPAHIRNARKGDIVLSPGCGEIASVLRSVTPPQKYSHSGIVVDTDDLGDSGPSPQYIRHSTAVMERIADLGSLFGLPEEALRFAEPGTITQDVNQAFTKSVIMPGYSQKEFESAGVWCPQWDPTVQGPAGLSIPSAWTAPLVVKPPPCSGDVPRRRAEDVADRAESINGHYRLFAFTDASISLDPTKVAPDGSVPTVCSSLLWTAASSTGVVMEGGVAEPGDRALAPGRDGLYRYSPAERLRAGNALHDLMVDRALSASVFDLGGLVSEPIANSVVSCLWGDRCVPDDTWRREPGTGQAVSPDDIRHWDSPFSTPGAVYGYEEPLFLRFSDRRPAHQWTRRPATTGVPTVRVIDSAGNPVAWAEVELAGTVRTTNASGIATFPTLPTGRYGLTAYKVTDGTLRDTPAATVVTVARGASTIPVRIDLRPEFRHPTVSGRVNLFDDDIDGDETAVKLVNKSVPVSLDVPTSLAVGIDDGLCLNDGWGSEVSARFDFTFTEHADNSLRIHIDWQWFEDNDSSRACRQARDTRRDGGFADLTVPANGRVIWSLPTSAVDGLGSMSALFEIANPVAQYTGYKNPKQLCP